MAKHSFIRYNRLKFRFTLERHGTEVGVPTALPPRLAQLEGSLIASCQPVRGGIFDKPDFVVAFARAAESSSAAALRIESVRDLEAVRPVTSLPIIGLIKRTVESTSVYITPELTDVDAVLAAGADIVAFDATERTRPSPVGTMIDRVHAAGKLAMADVSTVSEGLAAWEAGAEFVATTLSGYTQATSGREEPDFDLISRLNEHHVRVVAEGHIHSPEQAAQAIRRGAFAVTVGSAISRPEHIAGWYVRAITQARRTV